MLAVNFKIKLTFLSGKVHCSTQRNKVLIALGSCSETTRSIVALARGTTIKESGINLKAERMKKIKERDLSDREYEEEKKFKIQNKDWALQLIIETKSSINSLRTYRKKEVQILYKKQQMEIKKSLKLKSMSRRK